MSKHPRAALVHTSMIISGWVGPLLIFLLSKDSRIKEHSKQALHLQLSLFLYGAIFFLLAILLSLFASLIQGIVSIWSFWQYLHPLLYGLFGIIGVTSLTLGTSGAVKAYQGIPFQYPLCLQFLN